MTVRGLTAAEWGRRLEPHLKVVKPDGPGPFPVVVQFHGCGGMQPLQDRYARAAAEAGVAVVIVDSYVPRGISRLEGLVFICTGARLRGSQRAADLHAVLHWLEGQAWADPDRIAAAAGWSHGGWTVMDAFAHGDAAARLTGLADADRRTLERLSGLFLVYPYASFPSLTSARGWGGAAPRVFSVLAGRDVIVGVSAPKRALARVAADGAPVDTLFLAEATHSFDDDAANDPRVRYRPDLEAQARDYYVGALAKIFA